MGREIVRQPDGLWGVYSDNSHAFVLVNATPEEVIAYCIAHERRRFEDSIPRIRQRAIVDMAALDATPIEAARSFELCVRMHHAAHGGVPDSIDVIPDDGWPHGDGGQAHDGVTAAHGHG